MRKSTAILFLIMVFFVAGCGGSHGGSGGSAGLKVLLGDSILARGGATLGNAIGGQNLAVGGLTTVRLKKMLPEIIAMNPSEATIMIGINDLVSLRSGPAATYERIVEIIETLRAAGIKVRMLSLLPACTPGRSGEARHLSAKIQGYCLSQNLTYIDAWSSFVRGNINQIEDLFDGCLHLSNAGVAKMAEILSSR